MMYWFSMLAYLLISETSSLLDTWEGLIAFVLALLVFLLAFGILLCVLVRRGNRHEKRVAEDTTTLPNVRAGKMRGRYLG